METVNDPYLRHLFDDESNFNVYNTEIVNLSVGTPGPDLLGTCGKFMLKATEHRIEEEDKEGKHYLFQYGAPAGLWEYRNELQKFLSRRYGDPVLREHLVLTCGATHGLQLLLNTVMSPNGIIFVEEVTYMIALDALKQFPLMKIVTVPMIDYVVDLDTLQKLIKQEKGGKYYMDEKKIYWAMFYTIPTYHNPTGMTLPSEDCKRLVNIARDYDIAVVCDDVYNLLHYESGFPPHRLLFYDDPKDKGYKGGNIISNGSFTKILSPAIRLGWLESGPRVTNIVRKSGVLKSGGAVNHYVSGVITSLLHLGIQDKHLDVLIETYRERMRVAIEVLDQYLPRCCTYRKPQGGYFIWIRMPKAFDAVKIVNYCQEEKKVTAIPGSRFSNSGQSKNCLRVCMAFHKTETLRAAVKELCIGIFEYIQKNKCPDFIP